MTEPSGRGERGIQYPGDNLQDALQLLVRVKEAIGFGPASRETIAEALGYKGISGTSARKIGVLTHFDLLKRVGAGAYVISETGRHVLMPTDEQDKAHAVAEAATQPALYRALIEKYANHALPTMLSNLLAREFGVAPSSSEAAAQTFRETMEFAGLLRNGVLRTEPPAAVTELGTLTIHTSGDTEPATTAAQATGAQDYSIPLDSKGRLAKLRMPLPLTAQDLKRVRNWVDYITREVEGETPDISAN